MDQAQASEAMDATALAPQQNKVFKKRFGLARVVRCECCNKPVDQLYRLRVVDGLGDEVGHFEMVCEECKTELKQELQHD